MASWGRHLPNSCGFVVAVVRIVIGWACFKMGGIIARGPRALNAAHHVSTVPKATTVWERGGRESCGYKSLTFPIFSTSLSRILLAFVFLAAVIGKIFQLT